MMDWWSTMPWGHSKIQSALEAQLEDCHRNDKPRSLVRHKIFVEEWWKIIEKILPSFLQIIDYSIYHVSHNRWQFTPNSTQRRLTHALSAWKVNDDYLFVCFVCRILNPSLLKHRSQHNLTLLTPPSFSRSMWSSQKEENIQITSRLNNTQYSVSPLRSRSLNKKFDCEITFFQLR